MPENFLTYTTKMKSKRSIFKPGEPITIIVPPRIQAMLTGVSQIECAHPRYRLTYEDGSHEEAVLQGPALTEFFKIVYSVNATRKINEPIS